MKLTDEQAKAMWDGELKDWEEVDSREHDHGRWSYFVTKVFKKPCPPGSKGMDEYYGIISQLGNTEHQEDDGIVEHGPMGAVTVQKVEYKWY